MKISQILTILLALTALSVPACDKHEDREESEHHRIVVTSPKAMDVIIDQQYVCQIHAQRHIDVRALQDGYLEAIKVKEGQEVTKGEVMFSVVPILYEAKWEAEKAEAELARLELQYTEKLAEQKAVSPNEVALYKAKVARANAKATLAKRELDFTKVKAAFSGIIDRLHDQEGSLVKERDILTTLSDNSVMWVYFNVPERNYLAYNPPKVKKQGNSQKPNLPDNSPKDKSQGNSQKLKLPDSRIELRLADGSKFDYDAGDTVTVEAKFNNETGTVPFRADFPNPDRVLRHGMTGNIVIHKTLKNAVVIPQRATFEILDRRYVYVVGSQDGVVHQREILIQHELPDVYVIQKGLGVDDKFVYEGIRQVHDGEKVEYEFRAPEQVLENQRYPAE